MATEQQIQRARLDGMRAFGQYGVSHVLTSIGESKSQGSLYCNHTDPALVRAWMEGYEYARMRSL